MNGVGRQAVSGRFAPHLGRSGNPAKFPKADVGPSCRHSAAQEIIVQTSKPKPVFPIARPVVPWNKGAFVGPKPPLKPKQVWSIRLTLQREGRIRDLALFDLAVDSKLRGCDLVQLRIGQLVINAAARHRATIVQQKTGKPVRFELTQQTRESLIAWLAHRGGGLRDFVFPDRSDADGHISTRQYARLVGDWAQSIGLGRSACGTHSLHRNDYGEIQTLDWPHAPRPQCRHSGRRGGARRPGT